MKITFTKDWARRDTNIVITLYNKDNKNLWFGIFFDMFDDTFKFTGSPEIGFPQELCLTYNPLITNQVKYIYMSFYVVLM